MVLAVGVGATLFFLLMPERPSEHARETRAAVQPEPAAGTLQQALSDASGAALVDAGPEVDRQEQTSAPVDAGPSVSSAARDDGQREAGLDAYEQFLGRWPDLQKIEGPTWVGTRPSTPTQCFVDKYAGLSAEELQRARDSVHGEYTAARKQGFRERYSAGVFEVRPIDAARPFHTGPQKSGAPFHQVIRPANSNEAHIVSLPFDEYGHVYELADEYHWLLRQTGIP